MNSNQNAVLYPIQYAVPQQNPPPYEEVDCSHDFEMATLLSQGQIQTNSNIVYYAPVQQTSSISSVPFVSQPQLLVPTYAIPVVVNVNSPVQNVPVQILNPPANTCQRSRTCSSEHALYRSSNCLKFHLLLLLVLACFVYTFVYETYLYVVLTSHVIMLICGFVATNRRSVPSLVLLIIWLLFSMVVSIIYSVMFYYRNDQFHILLALNAVFIFFTVCNICSLLCKIRRCRVAYTQLQY